MRRMRRSSSSTDLSQEIELEWVIPPSLRTHSHEQSCTCRHLRSKTEREHVRGSESKSEREGKEQGEGVKSKGGRECVRAKEREWERRRERESAQGRGTLGGSRVKEAGMLPHAQDPNF